MFEEESAQSSDGKDEAVVPPFEGKLSSIPRQHNPALRNLRHVSSLDLSSYVSTSSPSSSSPTSSMKKLHTRRHSSHLLLFVKKHNANNARRRSSGRKSIKIKPTMEIPDFKALVSRENPDETSSLKLNTIALLARGTHLPSRNNFSCSGPLLENGSYILRRDLNASSMPELIDRNARDVVEFSAVEVLTTEDSEEVELTVVRRGFKESRLSFRYHNVDINMRGSFVPQSGVGYLEPGQRITRIALKIRHSPMWSPERLMDVELSMLACEGVTAERVAVLGDLSSCRVVALDLNSFPQDVDDLEAKSEVVVGFLMFLWQTFPKEVQWGFFFRLVPGLSFGLNQAVTYYLLARITADSSSSNVTSVEQAEILITAACFFVIFIFEMMADMCFSELKLKGKAQVALRTAAVDTVLQLSPVYHELYDTGKVMKVVDVQLDRAVSAFLTTFDLYSSLVRLIFIIFFAIYLGVDQLNTYGSDGSSLLLAIFIIAIPFVMFGVNLLLLLATAGTASRKDYAAMQSDDNWTSFVVQASFLRQVIITYRKGFKVTAAFTELHNLFNHKAFEADQHSKRTKWAATMFPKLCQAVVAGFAGLAAAKGTLPVATFVVFLSTVTKFGPTTFVVFTNLFDVTKGYASMKKLSKLLNSDTRRKQLYRAQHLRDYLLEEYRKNPANHWDSESMIIHNAEYAFKSVLHCALPRISCVIEAGQIVAVKGPGSIGKNCLLRLLARHFMPSKGFIYYPPNWRVRYVDAALDFFGGESGTFEANLKFGVQHVNPNSAAWDVEIWQLLNRLKLSEELIGETPAMFGQGRNPLKLRQIGLSGEKLSLTDRVLLSIARALLSSADLLLVSNILDLLPLDYALNAISVFRELTTNRCIQCLEHENKKIVKVLRKKKLIIFSTHVIELEKQADAWIALSK
mmetsp:Transcript_58041/g.114229  ORF Transcript_58041/g.114229 Transcript_58041/m.114229 type:complete len:915 (-) Transcript_58041:167-2911(-)